METTFMTIHNLGPEANILFASASVVDILGYQAHEITGRSCFDYFHPDEVPFARNVHTRGVEMDKAAVLHYARIKNRDNQWVGCECVFSVVHDVLVACTSVYKGDDKSEKRAVDAPAIRHLFSSSPKDPRYHMLEYLSAKFRTSSEAALREPRAALILNRFTRTLTVMYATNAVATILGVSPDELKDKSFYECMHEDCIPEAIRCLESAKANDSIAYLRFRYRNPRREEELNEQMREASQSSDSDDGGVQLSGEAGNNQNRMGDEAIVPQSGNISENDPISNIATQSVQHIEHTTSGESTDVERDSTTSTFETSHSSSTSSLAVAPERRERTLTPQAAIAEPFELEAVVSCTSDGLVVILRRARPMIPNLQPAAPQIGNGMFAAPWGVDPIRPHVFQPNPQIPFQHGLGAPVVQANAGGPPLDDFMNSIREVSVFAWSLVGINGNIASYSRGVPKGEAQPPIGLPIWDPYALPRPEYMGPYNQAAQKWSQMGERMNGPESNYRVPFQRFREEQNLRYGPGPMGSDRAGPSANAYLANQEGINDHFPQHQNSEGQNEGFAPLSARNYPPAAQGQGPSEGTH
ncbi:hypothetical protein B7494_g632 [Chlorociboria aeruginascens]|nr:hypothetical protein B7494_g632 [Chlorociboria aeruginascens]